MGALYQLDDSFEVAADLDRTWAFFSDERNLPLVTPPWLAFRNVELERFVMGGGMTLFEYRLKWLKLPVRWRSAIVDWSPPRQFINLQVKGPYSLWHHTHTFEPGSTGTICRDRVLYRVPGWLLGRALHSLVIRKQLSEIFHYRRKAIAAELGWVGAEYEEIGFRRLLR